MLTLEEEMALAVLRGDMVAARALADRLTEVINTDGQQLLPTKEIKIGSDNLRLIVYVADNHELTQDVFNSLLEGTGKWLRGEIDSLVLVGVDRIEVYQFPTPQTPKPEFEQVRQDVDVDWNNLLPRSTSDSKQQPPYNAGDRAIGTLEEFDPSH